MKSFHTTDSSSSFQDAGKNFKRNRVRRIVFGLLFTILGFALGLLVSYVNPLSASTKPSDDAIAAYRYHGKTYSITAQEVEISQYGVGQDSASEPTADSILSYSRNQILLTEAQSRGISINDEDLSNYAQTFFGTSDFSQIADQYGVDQNEAKEIVRQNAIMQALYEEVALSDTGEKLPQMPKEPEDGNCDATSKDYADYIIQLAGSEWDKASGSWARTDGPYYDALKEEDFSKDEASYSQALLAYNVAYQQYTEAASSNNDKWYSFINDLYKNASIEIFSLEA